MFKIQMVIITNYQVNFICIAPNHKPVYLLIYICQYQDFLTFSFSPMNVLLYLEREENKYLKASSDTFGLFH